MTKLSSFWFIHGALDKLAQKGICARPRLMHSLEKVGATSFMGGYNTIKGKHDPGKRTAQGANMSGLENSTIATTDFLRDMEAGRPEKANPGEEEDRVGQLLQGMKENGIEISDQDASGVLNRVQDDEETEDAEGSDDVDEISEANTDIRARLPFKEDSKPDDDHLNNFGEVDIDSDAEV